MILVTGASGLLGQHITAAFRNEDSLFGLGHSSALGSQALIDLTDSQAVKELLAKVNPGTIIHSAAIRDPDQCLKRPEEARKLHVEATRTLAEWAALNGKRLVYISTDYVFDGKNPPYDENSLPNPVNLYGETKLAGEMEAKKVKNHLIARISLQYGITARPEVCFLHQAVKRLKAGEKVVLDNVQQRFPAFSGDVARALLELQKRNYCGTIHMGTLSSVTRYAMWRMIAEKFGCDPSQVVDSGKPPALSASRPEDCTFNLGLYESLNLPKFHSFEEGLNVVHANVMAYAAKL